MLQDYRRAVPFLRPDVYQGTTYPNAALLSVIPKAAGFVALARILLAAMPGMEPYAWRAAVVISVLTMTVGNVLALWQDDLRRLLAYSSIAHAGYMLIGLAVGLATGNAPGAWNGLAALGFYLVSYAAATIGAFAVLEHLGRPERRIEGVEELAGLGRTRPLAAALLAVFLFSLTGVPPLAGFWGKLWLFGSALNVDGTSRRRGGLQPWFTGLAIVGVLNAAVAAAYYLRVVAVMYFRTPLATPRAEGGAGAWWAAVACGLAVVLIGLFPGPLMRETSVPSTRMFSRPRSLMRAGGYGFLVSSVSNLSLAMISITSRARVRRTLPYPLSQIIRIDRKDEIGLLGETINGLTSNIQEIVALGLSTESDVHALIDELQTCGAHLNLFLPSLPTLTRQLSNNALE